MSAHIATLAPVTPLPTFPVPSLITRLDKSYRAHLPTSFIAPPAIDVPKFTSVKLVGVSPTRLRNNDADKPVARHINSLNHSPTGMKVCALLPICGGNNNRERQEKCLIYR